MPVEAIAGMPSFVRGVAVIRGAPTAVVDAAALVSGVASHPTRFVTMKIGMRRIALAVDRVVGVVEIPLSSLRALPPLFQDASLEVIAAVGTLDAELLLVLQGTRLIAEEHWAELETGCSLA
jgi:purine-binding chemotaxis protein CheW